MLQLWRTRPLCTGLPKTPMSGKPSQGSYQKGWDGKGQPFDKGKGKGYDSQNGWTSVAPFQSKGKGKGGPKGFAKGGKGTYSVEQEWYPDATEGSWGWPEPPWSGIPQGFPTMGGAHPNEQEHYMLNLGMSAPSLEPTGWQVPSSRRTFKPGYPATCNALIGETTSGRFEVLGRDDNPQP